MYLFCTKQYNIYNLVLKAREFSITLDQTLINSLEKNQKRKLINSDSGLVMRMRLSSRVLIFVERVTAVIVPGSPSRRFLLENKGSGPEGQPE